MRILVLSNSSWNTDNSFGNTFENIFSDVPNLEIANVYCNYGYPNSKFITDYFQITEKRLLQNLKKKSISTGQTVQLEGCNTEFGKRSEPGQKRFDWARKQRWQILFWARDLIWAVGRWKSPELLEFVDKFQPDLIYLPIYYSKHMCEIGCFLSEYLDVPAVGHVTDDVYTLKRFRFSPLFWIDHLMTRSYVKKLMKKCVYVDTFTEIQKQEYEKIFKIPFHVIHKNADFAGEIPDYTSNNQPLKLIFTGNIGSGRWKTLALIGQALQQINETGIKAQLHLYTATPMSAQMKKALTIPDSILLCGQVPATEIPAIQQDGDILLHVESFDLKGKLEVRMSFSTKIVDYMMRGRAILAVGPHDVASVDFLKRQDCAITATNQAEIKDKLSEMIAHPELLEAYRQKAWQCGKTQFHAKTEKEKFLKNLKLAVGENHEDITNQCHQ